MENERLVADLRDAAVRYCELGWPILPVCYPLGDRLIAGRPPSDPAAAKEWWSDQPYGIACLTGVLFDALEVPSPLGPHVLAALGHNGFQRDDTPLVIERPVDGAWQFLVTTDSPTIPDLPRGIGVTLHRAGHTLRLPPTPLIGRPLRWIARSQPTTGRLPHSLAAQWAVVRAATTIRRSGSVGAASARLC